MAKKQDIKLFEDKKVRSVWDEEQEKWYFCVVDVIEILTDSVNPTDYLKKMKKRDPELAKGWGQIVTPLSIQTAGGKQRVNCATTEGILRIIQSIPSSKAEPFKLWMAQVASQRFAENMIAASEGGEVARVAKEKLEEKTGRQVVSPLSAKRFFEEQKKKGELPEGGELEKK